MTGPVLVIEDDPDIARVIAEVLRRDGLQVAHAADGKRGLREFHERRPALVILDIGLPALDGWHVLARLRELSDAPVLIVTAHGYEADKVRGLQSGADDYLVKPFGNAELLARARALLRRTAADRGGQRRPAGPAPGSVTAPAVTPEPAYDDRFLRIDPGTREVTVAGQGVPLTPTEYRLLHALASHAGQVLSAPQLLELAWNDPARIGPDRVKFSIMRLRRKLGGPGPDGSPIEAVRGFGYRYVPPEPR